MSHHALEESTFVIQVALFDEQGDLLTPTDLAWSLRDSLGVEVVSNEVTPASEFDVVLSGSDLAITEGEEIFPAKRTLLIDATYDSNFGSGLPLRAQFVFFIDRVTNA